MTVKKPVRDNNASLGAILVVLGLLVLVFNLLGLGLGPLIVAGVGLGLFVVMMLLGKSSGWLAVPASVVTMVGLLLIYTSVFNHGRSWAYSWTLLFGAAGMGTLISHYWSGRPQDTRFGSILVQASLVAFVGFGLFFEVLIFSRGLFGRLLWPAVLILLGGYLLLRARGGAGRSEAKPRPVRSKPRAKTAAKRKAKADEVEFEPLKVAEDAEAVPTGKAASKKAR